MARIPVLEDLGDVAGKRVLVRTDFNVPMEGPGDARRITDDFRIRAALPTINWLMERGASVVCATHLGRPKGAPEQKYSLAPVRARLAELAPGVDLLENLRVPEDVERVDHHAHRGGVELFRDVERLAQRADHRAVGDVHGVQGFDGQADARGQGIPLERTNRIPHALPRTHQVTRPGREPADDEHQRGRAEGRGLLDGAAILVECGRQVGTRKEPAAAQA